MNELNGPNDWALPYWNYLNQSKDYREYKIPPAFNVQTLPDGSSNPIYVPERYGPSKLNNEVYVEIGQDLETDANDECQWDNIYSESSASNQAGIGNLFGNYYGGEETGFSHSNRGFGDLEMNPHNYVHSMVGGNNDTNGQMGLMGVPATAALDPIFFLHHANIDRMWDAWNTSGQNNNPTNPIWLMGPQAHGNSQFAMPMNLNAKPWYYTPDQVKSTTNIIYNNSNYSYTYDDLSLTSYDKTPPTKLKSNIFNRLSSLGIESIAEGINMNKRGNNELVGASESLSLNDTSVNTKVKLNQAKWGTVSKSLMEASIDNIPDEVYLQLEDVKGSSDTNFLSVYINGEFVKTISLFGLLEASLKSGLHGVSGITYTINITDFIDKLHLDSSLNIDSLDIQVKTKQSLAQDEQISIGRISIYRSSM